MNKLPMWLGIAGIILFYLFLLWYSPGQPCLEWDGRICIEREVNPESTWPFTKEGKRTYEY